MINDATNYKIPDFQMCRQGRFAQVEAALFLPFLVASGRYQGTPGSCRVVLRDMPSMLRPAAYARLRGIAPGALLQQCRAALTIFRFRGQCPHLRAFLLSTPSLRL